MQQRYYDPELGVFPSTDPVTPFSPGGAFNRYWYANANPYRMVDPDGRQSAKIHEGDTEEQRRAAQAERERRQNAARDVWDTYIRPSVSNGIRAALAEGRIVGGAGQVALGKGLCATVAGCGIGLPMIAHGVGNIGGGASDYANIFGGNHDWNITGKLYSFVSMKLTGNDYGKPAFAAVDTALSGYALLRKVPVTYYNPQTPTITGTAARPAFWFTPAGALINDGAQAADTVQQNMGN